MKQAARRHSLVVGVVEQNRLAAEYLLSLLTQDSTICSFLPEDFTRRSAGESLPLIFLLDNAGLSLPLAECLRQLALQYPKAKYMVLDSEQSDENIVRMLALGVHGFLRHRDIAQSLLRAVHAIAEGQMWVSSEVLQSYVQFTASTHRPGSLGRETTTLRETEIIDLVKRRLSNKEIARILRIQESTVKFHLSNIFGKLHVPNRHALLDKTEPPDGWAEILGSSRPSP